MKMNNLGRGNWILMFGFLIVGMMVFVGATVSWDAEMSQYINLKNSTENSSSLFIYNFTGNVSFGPEDSPLIYSFGTDSNISTSIYGSEAFSFFSDWISINSSFGLLEINASEDNRTGAFNITFDVYNSESTQSAGARTFNFIINATNDAPNFTSSGIADNYSFDSNGSLQSLFLYASDEESHFPLNFSITFNSTNCTHGANTGYADNENCSLFDFGMTFADIANESANISFVPNSSHIGTYWANISVMDAATLYDCPHDWCDATYNTTNLTTYYSKMVPFTVAAVLGVDVSNCTGATLMEDTQFNCTIVITSPGETDNLTLTSDATARSGSELVGYNSSWFYPSNNVTASNFNYNVSISVTPTKTEVANLTISFTADNGEETPVSKNILIYVNFTESNVTLDAISDLNGVNALYEDYTFQVNATDEDLLVLDSSVKAETLTFNSNTSWVSIVALGQTSGANYTTANITIDHSAAILDNGTGNYAILINVTDTALGTNNTDNKTFVVEILDDVAPNWTLSSTPTVLNLVEGTLFTYNVSMNVSDEDGDAITFYYQNNSGQFCSLNSSSFNSTSGMISLTPVDCDVGYHNVTITASDGKLNSSHEFNFTVSNVADDPSIHSTEADTVEFSEGDIVNATEDIEITFELIIDDDDFLIPLEQKSFYDESLTVNVTATNLSGTKEELFQFSFVGIMDADASWIMYNATFTPNGTQTDYYTISINITDNSSASIGRIFYLNVSAVSNYPNITAIDNQSTTIHDYFNFTINATDEEDNRAGLNLSYFIANLSVGAPDLTIGNESGIVELDMNSDSSYAGIWYYNVTVEDSNGQNDSEAFYLYVYGNATLEYPALGPAFDLTENNASVLNFTINHSIANNLTYEFWIDSLNCSYQNSSDCTYRSLELRETKSSFGNGNFYNWTFTPNYTDETYGNYKNLTVRVYPNTTDINSTQRSSVATNFTFKLDISHTNAPVRLKTADGFPTPWTDGYVDDDTDIIISNYFIDEDYLDSFYQQETNFTVTSSKGVNSLIYAESSTGNPLPWNGTLSDWTLQISASSPTVEVITINVTDNSSSQDSSFNITFKKKETEVVTTPTSGGGGGGSSVKLKHFSLKIIAPHDVVISDLNYIDVPFSVENNGEFDLKGINLNSLVSFNDEFSSDVSISLADNYIELLKFGQSENFTMRISANTQRAGKYKATILANVTSPKFSDWGEFIIELKKTNESEAEQILIFTEKFISENPECLELTELIRRAEDEFLLGDYSKTMELTKQATEACEDAIVANEQIKYPITGFVKDNFYYISFSTLVIFLLGFVFYVYKRVRFNKYKVDEYI